MRFIQGHFKPGYNHYSVKKLLGDASARQYFRYVAHPNRSFILAAYPEPFDPARFSYKQVYDLFREIGVPVPEIEALDGELGIVLQEDLGDESLQMRLRTANPEARSELLKRAVDLIVRIQKEGGARLRPDTEAAGLAFDEEKLTWELNFFLRFYLARYRNSAPRNEKRLSQEFDRIARELAAAARVLCHRDFHVRNLMLKNESLYVIDFQDARWGPPSYDLASLLKDSIELGAQEVSDLVDHYLARRRPAIDRGEFLRQFHLMAVQRLLKALGTYGYQITVRENFIYEQYMTGSLYRVLLSLDALPEFPETRSLAKRELSRMERSN